MGWPDDGGFVELHKAAEGYNDDAIDQDEFEDRHQQLGDLYDAAEETGKTGWWR